MFCKFILKVIANLTLVMVFCTGQAYAASAPDTHQNMAPLSELNSVQAAAIASYIDISAGDGHTCAVTSTGGVKCWGSNTFGQLGNGTYTGSNFPVDVTGLASGVLSVSVGWMHSCVVTNSGGVKCWGANNLGQLGDGTNVISTTPVDVSGLTSGVKSISVGELHTCAVTNSGGVKCWGENSLSGKLGNGTTTDSNIPVDVSGLTSGVDSVSAGDIHTCVVTITGGAKCWGSNYHGILGDGTYHSSNVPVDVNGLTSGLVSISVGGVHTCAVTDVGGVKCWGSNLFKQLGTGTNIINSTVPVDVSGLTSGVSSVSAGVLFSCALTNTGGVKCWGDNYYGKLGNGTSGPGTSSNIPLDVGGLTSGVDSVSTGDSHTCVVTTTGGAKCWGYNASGENGNGTNTDSYIPVKVVVFGDVPDVYWANNYVERLYNAGITSGCTTVPFSYCPDNTVNRAQMAVFLLKGIHGPSYLPPAVGAITGFADVPIDHWAAAWIKQLAAEGITSGCGGGNYCPGDTVTRAQMAVFLLKSKYGVAYVPPTAVGVFPDAVGHWAENWVEQLYNESITSGCAGGNYCPQNPVTRAQMAVFLVKTFNLP